MTRSRTIDYYLATGLVRTREDRMVTSEALQRMLSADSASSAYTVLSEFDYADELLSADKPEQYDAVIAHDLIQMRDFLLQMTDDSVVHGILFSEFDFHNIKVFVKEMLFDLDLSEHIAKAGAYDPVVLREALQNPSDFEGETQMSSIIVDVKKNLLEGKDISSEFVDSFVDRQMFAYRLYLSKKSGVKFLIELSKRYIDLANMRLVIRGRSLGKEFSFVVKRFVENGNLPLAWFEEHYELSEEEIAHVELRVQSLDEMFVEPYTAHSLSEFERNIERYEVRLARKALNASSGPEVLYGYVKLKIALQRDIRRVMSGKLNGVDSDVIYSKLTSIE